MALDVGDTLPDFTLPDQNGKPVSLADLRGENLVLFFYPHDNTPVCTKEACAFRDAYEQFVATGTQVVGVSSDSSGSHEEFASVHRLPYGLLSDEGGRMRKAFGVPRTLGLLPGRVTYVVDREGIVRGVFNSALDGPRHVTEALAILERLR